MPKSYQIFTKFGLINHGGTKRCQGFYYYFFFLYHGYFSCVGCEVNRVGKLFHTVTLRSIEIRIPKNPAAL